MRCALLPYEIEELGRVGAYGPVQMDARRFGRLARGGWVEAYDEEIGGWLLARGAEEALLSEDGSVNAKIREQSRVAQAMLLTIRSRAFDIEQRVEYALRFPSGRGAIFDALLGADTHCLASLILRVCAPLEGVPECNELLRFVGKLRMCANMEPGVTESLRRLCLHANRLAAQAAFGKPFGTEDLVGKEAPNSRPLA
jgi:hypothetical protein